MYDVLNEKSPNAGGYQQEGTQGDLNCTADETRGQLFSCEDAARFVERHLTCVPIRIDFTLLEPALRSDGEG
jgi:hypothetical protein